MNNSNVESLALRMLARARQNPEGVLIRFSELIVFVAAVRAAAVETPAPAPIVAAPAAPVKVQAPRKRATSKRHEEPITVSGADSVYEQVCAFDAHSVNACGKQLTPGARVWAHPFFPVACCLDHYSEPKEFKDPSNKRYTTAPATIATVIAPGDPAEFLAPCVKPSRRGIA